MERYLLILFILCFSNVKAQFPFFKGIQSNNVLISSVESTNEKTASIVNYDFSNSRVALVLTRLNLKASQTGVGATVINRNFGIGVNLSEGNFNLFKGEFNPGFDITKQWQNQKFLKTNATGLEVRNRSRIWAVKPLFATGKVETISTTDSLEFKTNSLWKVDLGLDIGWGMKWEDKMAITSALSISVYGGYRWNNIDHLSKVNTFTTSYSGTKNGSLINIGSAEQYYFGEDVESLLGLIKIDFMRRLWQPEDKRDNLGLYAIFRWSSQLTPSLKPVNSFFGGLSLAKPYNDVKASVVAQFIDYYNDDKNFKDIVILSVQYGIKLEN